MIRFRLVYMEGKFEEGEITMLGDDPFVLRVGQELQAMIEYEHGREHYRPGIDVSARIALEKMGAEIIFMSDPPEIPPGADA